MTTLIYALDPKLARELLATARGLDDRVVAAVCGGAIDDPQSLVGYGADEVVVAESPNLDPFTSDAATEALAAVVADVSPDLILVAGTRSGKEVAPRVAARLGAACITLASAIRREDDGLRFDRSYLGGKTVATEVAKTDVVVATVPPHADEPLEADASRSGDVRTLAVDIPEPRVKVLGVKERSDEGVDLEGADVIVAVGRGFKAEADLQMAFDLAKLLGGEVGCSRPLATDLGWLTDEYWIGLSGKTVKPRLYIAAGISGQIQHTTGIRGAETIVAINADANAPIFKVSDLGIVGDLYKVLPALTKALEAELGS